MGRPRKLKEADSNTLTETMDSTVVNGPVITMDANSTVSASDPNITSATITTTPDKNRFLPFMGPQSLQPNEPRFFVNGRKLLRVIKTQHGHGDDGKPVYVVSRTLFRMIHDNKKAGKVLRAQLKALSIPGA